MSEPISKWRAAYELEQSTLNGRRLINEVNRWIISQQKELIHRMEEDSISKAEFDESMSEIRQMERQLTAFSEQLESSENRVKKVFGKNEKNS